LNELDTITTLNKSQHASTNITQNHANQNKHRYRIFPIKRQERLFKTRPRRPDVSARRLFGARRLLNRGILISFDSVNSLSGLYYCSELNLLRNIAKHKKNRNKMSPISSLVNKLKFITRRENWSLSRA